ncbi:MAG: diacylglycerol kinase family lipid kinase [Peptococcaceae bacterium]|nr:diacylglycerol kinase family lipid kinase [Peptococcaceae bacterium]
MKAYEKWLAIVNPFSANGRTRQNWARYWQEAKQAGIDLEYCLTSCQGDGIKLTKQGVQQGYKKFIAVGGDGTVNEVVNGLMADDDRMASEDIELAVFALGTGSDFIRSFQGEIKAEDFINSLQRRNTRKIDLGKVIFQNSSGQTDSRYFINASNIGLGAEVVNEANMNSKALGSKLTYFSRVLTTLSRYKNIEASLLVDNELKVEGRFCGLMVCNGKYIGGGMKIAPDADLRDGLFDLVVIKDISALYLLSRIPLIYSGKHINLPAVDIYRCQSLKIETPEHSLLEIDGEIPGTSPSAYYVLPQCLAMRG